MAIRTYAYFLEVDLGLGLGMVRTHHDKGGVDVSAYLFRVTVVVRGLIGVLLTLLACF